MLWKMALLLCPIQRVNEKNQRLIFFGKYAGYAGMIETLHAFGKKLKLQGIDNSFEEIKQAFEYNSVEEAKSHIRHIGKKIRKTGLPSPGIFGFTGYGNVSQAAQEILDLMPVKAITPDDLESHFDIAENDTNHLYKVVFAEQDMVKSISGPFNLQEYYDHPEKYKSQFHKYLPFLSVIVNCIYWTEAYPRLLTKKYLANNPDIELSIIGDISVDIDGSIEITNKATYPDHPTYTYNPHDATYHDGIIKNGISIMAIDNLPCEFPKESSSEFSKILKEFIPGIINLDFDVPFRELSLPEPIKKALILQNGELTDDYQYMNKFIK
jgi:alpha-aminoadipic semialdehyde synthase